MSNLNRPVYIDKRKTSAHLDLNGIWDYCYIDKTTDEISELEYSLNTKIPNSAYWSLYESGILPHPYEECNCTQYHWVDEKVWYYRKKFVVTKRQQKKEAHLCFDAVAYYCRVWINGHLLGEHEGMFGGPVVEISSFLKYGTENEIVVEVKAVNFGKKDTFNPWNRLAENSEIVPWNIARDKETSNGEFIVMGIWQGVRIEFLNKIHISRPYIYTKKILFDNEECCSCRNEKSDKDITYKTEKNNSVIYFECEIISPYDRQTDYEKLMKSHETSYKYNFAYHDGLTGIKKDETVEITIEISEKTSGKTIFSQSEKVALLDYDKLGISKDMYEGQFYKTEFILPNAKLWFPNGMGEAFLYDVNVILSYDNKEQDSHKFPFGIRTIEVVESKGEKYRKRWGKFQFVINGKEIFLKGMNWMPIDFLYKLEKEEYRWTLETAKNSGIQLLRCWSGGGFPETDEFYEMCNELGIMVWQDSFIANMLTPKWDKFILQTQVEYYLYRIRNHPSLAVHCGGNEFAAYHEGNAGSMFIISREVADIDPSRYFFRTTPDGGSAHIYRDMEPTWYRHLYKQLPFIAESGMHSFPNSKSLRQLISKEEYKKSLSNIFSEEFKKTNAALANHFTEFNPERIPRMLSRASHINNIENISLDDLAEATQIASYEYYQVMIQATRENYPVTTGILPWVYRRAWTTVGIQLVDGLGEPIAPYYAVKRAYEDVLVFAKLDHLTYAPEQEMHIPVSLINEGEQDLKSVNVTFEILNPELKVERTLSVETDLPISEYQKTVFDEVFYIPKEYKNKFFFIRVAVYGKDNKLINQSFYWIKCLALLSDKKVLHKYHTEVQPNIVLKQGPWLKRQIAKLKKSELCFDIDSVKKKENRIFVDITIDNKSEQYIFPVKIEVLQDKTLCYSDDNYFVMSPNEKRKITLTIYVKNNRLRTLDISVFAWNTSRDTKKINIK